MSCSKHDIEQGSEQQILSKELKEDKKLQLSSDIDLSSAGFKKIIVDSLQPIYTEDLRDKLNALNKLLKEPVSYPNDYIFTSLLEGIYKNPEELYTSKDGQSLHGKEIIGDWKLLTVGYLSSEGPITTFVKDVVLQNVTGGLVGNTNGYSGAAYWNPNTQQVIVVHSGTKNYGGWDADIKGVFLNQHVAQIDSAVTFTDKIVSVLKEVNKEKGSNIQLFITGHSLGAWLAPITAFSAKYLKKEGDYFVANPKFEETGYHASTVIFDGPGCRSMLERIQDRLMSRCSPSRINSLDITNYLSAPNVINACNHQVGEVYRIFIRLSEEDKKYFHECQKVDITNLAYTCAIMHKIGRIKEVFDHETGEVLKDEKKNVRIKKVQDWPLLISGDEEAIYRDKAAKVLISILRFVLPEKIVKTSKFIYEAIKCVKWYSELQQELNNFFRLANETNSYHLDDKSTCLKTGGRKIRYRTENLNENYKNEHSLNAFTQPECQFLERYKFLERFQDDLQGIVLLEELFDSFEDDKELMNSTMKILKSCRIENGTVNSKNIQEFIHYIKHMLHLFPEIKSKVETAYDKLPSDIYNRIYQLISSSYLSSIKDCLGLEFEENNLPFLNDNLQVLHVIQSNTLLGAASTHKALQSVESGYEQEKCHAFLNLDRLFYLGEEIFINFLKKIDHKYLLVIECDDVLNDKIKKFLEKLLESLQDYHSVNAKHLKVILVTEKGSDLSKFISKSEYVVNNASKYREENSKLKLNDLTPNSQRKLAEKAVIFQGKEVPLSTVVNGSNSLNKVIDPETIVELFKNQKIEVGKALPSLGETEDYYIDRKLVKKVKVKEEALKDDNLTDLFAISNIRKEELSKLVSGGKVRNFGDEDHDSSSPVRFITLNKNAEEENFQNLCDRYSDHTIHYLKKEDNVGLIWKRSCGKTLSGLRRYIENCESDLPEDEYLENNTSVKVVVVNDISKFDEKLIVIAAEPGMGKTTVLTHLGTRNTDNSKWLIRINLVEYKDKLEQRNFGEEGSVVTFLHENNIVSNALAKKLLELRLNESGNIVFLLDGFDEITSEGQKNIVNLIKKLQETKVEKVLISTRLHLRNELENSLSTVSYSLKPFSREDQKQFLKKFWQRNLDPRVSQTCLDNYIKKLLEFISRSIGDKERKFMGIPMQMRMIAEAFQKVTKDQELLNHPECTFPENFDMLKLYDHFVDAKYQVYFGKIGVNDGFNEVQKGFFTKELNKMHMNLAIRVLFPEMKAGFIGEKLMSGEKEWEMNLVGIVQFIDDRIVFTHRTFGEHFVASFLADRLSTKKNSQKYEAVMEFLAKELFENKNEVIKTFLDYRLAKEKIHVAVLKGKLDDIKSILSRGSTNVNVTDTLGRSVIHYAAQEGHKETVDILINKGADIRKLDELGKTALHYAARYNHGKQVVSCLLENAKDCINKKDKNAHTPVYYAAQQGNWDIVDCILSEKGASVEGLDKEKLLFHYTYKGSLESIQNVLGEEEMDVTAIKDNCDNTLLHIAAQKGHLTIVEFLLEKKAQVGVANNSGRRPISYAADGKHWNIIESLLRKDAKFNDLNDKQKLSLLKYSTENAHWGIVKLFMEDNNRYNYFSHLDSQQRVELLCDIIRFKDLDASDLDVAKFLIEKGTAVNCSDGTGKRPIYYAAENDHWNIVQVLFRNNANFDYIENIPKDLLLYYSAQSSNIADANNLVVLFLVNLNSQQKVFLLSDLIDCEFFDGAKFLIKKATEIEFFAHCAGFY